MDNLYQCDDLATLRERIADIRASTDRNGFSVVRGYLQGADLEACRDSLERSFSADKDVRVSGAYTRGMEDIQRLDLGEYGASSRFCRYFFRFPWNENPCFSLLAGQLFAVRNLISGKHEDYGRLEHDPDSERFGASYVIQYPTGGGFMSCHREYTIKDEGDNAYVVYTLLSSKGTDYVSGGGYIVDDNEERVIIDDRTEWADLVIYRGDKFHGVANIDADKPVQLDRVCGRLMFTAIINYF